MTTKTRSRPPRAIHLEILTVEMTAQAFPRSQMIKVRNLVEVLQAHLVMTVTILEGEETMVMTTIKARNEIN